MRIARVQHDGVVRAAAVMDEHLVCLRAGITVLDLLAATPTEREHLVETASEQRLVLADQRLLAPIVPASVRDFVSYEQHIEGMSMSMGERYPESRLQEATFYFGNPHAVLGPRDDVSIPPDCRQFDYELEVAAVIGRAGRDLDPQRATEHIAGFTIFNDWTARDVAQRARRNSLHAIKGKDFAITLGPWIITTDELEPYWRGDMLDLGLSVSRNGVEMGTDRTSAMMWSFGEIVSYASRGAWIGPGDVIASGTCGNGCLAEFWGRSGSIDPPPLVAGDVISMTVEGIGTIESQVRASPPNEVPVLPARRLRPPS